MSSISTTSAPVTPLRTNSSDSQTFNPGSPPVLQSVSGVLLSSWAFALGVMLLGMLLRFWAMSRVDILSRDGFYYCVVARKIQDGHWLTAAQGWFIFNPYPPLMALTSRLTGWSVEFSGQMVCAIPSALGVIPLFFWVKNAFNLRIARITALLYVFHPILIRTSGEVMREGLYWLAMLSAIFFLWEGVQRRSIWRGMIGGLWATAAMLTRIEGIAIFPLIVLWCGWQWMFESRSWRERSRLTMVAGVSCAMLPITIIGLNVALIPEGNSWQGIGRFEHLIQLVVDQLGESDGASDRAKKKSRMRDHVERDDSKFQLAAFETFRVSPVEQESSPLLSPENSGSDEAETDQQQSRRIGAPRDVRDLAKSLPVWDKDCVADPVWYRLQRFLVMADDQSEAVYLGVLLNRLIQGLLVPVLFFCWYGLRYGKGEYWRGARDWPLLCLALMLFVVFYFHLSTEHVLEARYLFCLIPFVFPWTAIGAAAVLDHVQGYLESREQRRLYGRTVSMAFVLLAAVAVVHATPRNDMEKTVQKLMGKQILARDGFGKHMAAPESLKRMAYYADSQFQILPRQVSEIGPWLAANPVEYVVLGGKELSLYSRLLPQLDGHPAYERIFTEDSRFNKYFIYRARSLGNFATPVIAADSD